jgi:phosphotriesterase-related protein
MLRREFCAAGALGALQTAPHALPGSILVHEHVLVDFIGADLIAPGRYDRDEAFRAALPKLEELKPHGCTRLLECTPNFLGRDPRLLERLERATGIELWTNTGIYGAANHRYVPGFAKDETSKQLAARWVREFNAGVDGRKPRFIKTGVNIAPLHPWDRKLVEAAVYTSLETGLPIASHTSGGGRAALEQLEILDRLKCPLSKFVWVHAQNEKDFALHERIARAGAWVELDGINARSAEFHRRAVLNLHAKSLLGRVLISQDSGWYRVGEPGGGNYRGYTFIYTDFLPSLPEGIRLPLMAGNPRQAFGD